MKRVLLSRMKIKTLRKMERKEKNPKAKKRLLACILRREGKTLVEIANIINEPYPNVQRWIKNVEEGGLERIYDIKNKGAECKLTEKQLEQLVKDLEQSPDKFDYHSGMWNMPLVKDHIKKKFKVEYNVHSVRVLVRRMGFRLVTPRSKLQGSATAKEIKKYHKKSSSDVKKVGQEGVHHTDSRRGPHRAWIRA